MMLKLLVTMALMSAVSVAGNRSDDATTCTATDDETCNAGFSLEGGTCTACVPPAASVCGNGKVPNTAPILCPAGNSAAYTVDTDATGDGCVACGAAGKFTAASGDGCTDCSAGAATCTGATADSTCNEGFSLEGTTCTACELPSIAACGPGKEPTSQAIACPQDNSVAYTNVAPSSAGCVACGAGKFAAASGADGCTDCRPDAATCTSITVDETCNAGFSLEVGTCTACAPPAASVCGNGKVPNTAPSVCTQGNSATYTVDTDATGTGCVPCGAGKFAAADSADGCTACAVEDGANSAFHGLLAFAGAAFAASLIVV